jgi:hypothetical protein
MSRSSRRVLALVLPLAALAAALAAPAPAHAADAVALSESSEFRSIDPQVVALHGGGAFAVWENLNQGLWGRALGADGTRSGGQRLLVANPPTPPNPGEGWWLRNTQPTAVPIANGGFLLVWVRETTYLRAAAFHYTSEVERRDLFVQRFSPDGTPLTAERRINDVGAALTSQPAIVPHGASRFLVVWQQAGEAGGVRARVLASDGRALGREIQVAGAGAEQPAVSVNASGDALVAWSALADGGQWGIFARLYDRTMIPLADAFQVSGQPGVAQRLPRVAGGADDSFLVAWWARSGEQRIMRGVAQLVTAAGALAGGEKAIGVFPEEHSNLAPNVVGLPAGGYAHLWMGWGGWYATGIFVERLDAAGDATGEPALVSDSRPVGAHHFGVAVGRDGTLFTAWEGFNGRDRGIRGRALPAP